MSTHLALLAHWLATVSCVRSLLPWCPDHPSPPRQTGRVTRSPQLYLAVGALAHHEFFIRTDTACNNGRDCGDKQTHEVGTHNSFWLLRNRDFTKCLTCLGQRTTVTVAQGPPSDPRDGRPRWRPLASWCWPSTNASSVVVRRGHEVISCF